MSDNLLQTLQHLIQDVIAPDVRELKVRVSSLEKQMDVRFDALEPRFDAIDSRFDALEPRFDAIDSRFDSVNSRFDSVNARFDAMEKRGDAQFEAIMAALRESKAQSELVSFRAIAALSERVAVLESQRQ